MKEQIFFSSILGTVLSQMLIDAKIEVILDLMSQWLTLCHIANNRFLKTLFVSFGKKAGIEMESLIKTCQPFGQLYLQV